MRPVHGTLRLTRTALLAGACTGIAWVGHNLSADHGAGVGGFLLATAFLLGLLWRFTRIMRGFGDIFTVMALAQVALHLILQLAGPGIAPVEHAGHASAALGLAPGMLFAHLWAALLASALLAHGESALWFLAGTVARALPLPARLPDLVTEKGGAAPFAPPALGPSSPEPSTHGPRGPPGSPAFRPTLP
ncbi:copper resistance protein [Nocardiopsis sp. NPDC007018]|uniref:copper resistance protein n=1 Tax=Nocardiopsis sp. NPDC007018 TaxID=3155721 RepID=UPI0033CBC76E